MIKISLFEKVIDVFGKDNQERKTMEELSELIRAISRKNRKNIIEEIADVEIMIEQIQLIYNIKIEEIIKIRIMKIDRLKKFCKKKASIKLALAVRKRLLKYCDLKQ